MHDSFARILGLAGVALFSTGAQAQLALEDPSGLSKALSRADRTAVAKALQSSKANPIMRDLANALLDGRTEQAEELAQRCVDKAIAAGAVPAALYCNTVLANKGLARGNLQKWAARMRWQKETGLPALREKLGPEKPLSLGAFDTLDFAAIEALPAMQEAAPTDDGKLKITRDGASGNWHPLVDIEVNGTALRAMVDTGAAFSLLLTPTAARRLGVSVVASNLPLVSNPDPSRPRSQLDSLAQVSELKFGSITLRHSGALVMPGFDPPGIDAIVGLPLLQRYAGVVLGDEDLELLAHPPSCPKGEAVTFSTSEAGSSVLTVPVRVNGTPMQAELDTGAGGLMEVRGEPPPLPAKDVGDLTTWVGERATGRYEAKRALAQAKLEVLNHALGKTVISLFPTRLFEFPGLLGTSLLDGRKLTISFADQRACLAETGKKAKQ